MKILKDCNINTAFVISISYFLLSISIQGANIASIVYLPEKFYAGFMTQGAFQIGSIIGSLMGVMIIDTIYKVRSLIVASFLGSLYPIFLPISSLWEDWEFLAILVVLSIITGLGFSYVSLAQTRVLIKIQALRKRSPCVGIQLMIVYLSGICAGVLLCFPSITQRDYEDWVVSLLVGVFGALSITLNWFIKDQEMRLIPNKGTNLHPASFILSFTGVGVSPM
jgi:hypothetical protein